MQAGNSVGAVLPGGVGFGEINTVSIFKIDESRLQVWALINCAATADKKRVSRIFLIKMNKKKGWVKMRFG